MPTFIVVTPLRNGGPKPIPPGQPVELEEREGAALVLLGALRRPAAADAAPAPESSASPTSAALPAPPSSAAPSREKPLGQQTKAELRATAAREGVEVAEHATNAQIVTAIEAKRAAA